MNADGIRRGLWALLAIGAVLATSALAFAAEVEGHGGEAVHGVTPVPWGDMVEALVNFTIFAALLYYFVRKPLKNYLEKRSQTVAIQLEEAAELRRQAEEKLAEYEAKLSRFEEERRAVIEGYKRDAAKEREAIVAEARQNAKRIRADTQVAIEFEVKRAQERLRDQIVEDAVRLARRTIEERLDAKARDRLIDEYTDALAGLKGQSAP